MKEHNEKLNLGKGSSFVKSHLSRLPRTDEVWEADIQSISAWGWDARHHGELWLGMVMEQIENFHLALLGSEAAPDVPKMIAEGYDPVHAAYIFVHRITSVFSENVSRLPEMRTHAQEVGSAEKEYMPSGPPMSPLTTSFFSCWAFLDLRIGKTTDTLAGCLIEANDSIWMNPDQLEALRRMSQSRMGIFEHKGTEDNHVRLRELITDREFVCHSGSGNRGKKGELWYVRLLPPLVPELATYHIVFTTPYCSDRCNEEGLDRFHKAQHCGYEVFQRSRSR